MSQGKTVKDVLIKARSLIVEKGWIQGAIGNAQIGFCALGAIEAAVDITPYGPSDTAVERSARSALRAAVGRDEIASWNDAADTTKETVLAGFDKAIQRSE